MCVFHLILCKLSGFDVSIAAKSDPLTNLGPNTSFVSRLVSLFVSRSHNSWRVSAHWPANFKKRGHLCVSWWGVADINTFGSGHLWGRVLHKGARRGGGEWGSARGQQRERREGWRRRAKRVWLTPNMRDGINIESRAYHSLRVEWTPAPDSGTGRQPVK